MGHNTEKVEKMKKVEGREITVRFMADTAATMKWDFKPQQHDVKVLCITSFACSTFCDFVATDLCAANLSFIMPNIFYANTCDTYIHTCIHVNANVLREFKEFVALLVLGTVQWMVIINKG